MFQGKLQHFPRGSEEVKYLSKNSPVKIQTNKQVKSITAIADFLFTLSFRKTRDLSGSSC